MAEEKIFGGCSPTPMVGNLTIHRGVLKEIFVGQIKLWTNQVVNNVRKMFLLRSMKFIFMETFNIKHALNK